MSISASINIKLLEKNIPTQKIIETIKNTGWALTQNNYTSYLPFGDNEMFDWQTRKDMPSTELNKLLKAKQDANEIIGLFLTWQKTDIGGSFLFWPEHSYTGFAINLSSDRQYIKINNTYKITDFNWYLEKLLPYLDEAFGVSSFTCEQDQ